MHGDDMRESADKLMVRRRRAAGLAVGLALGALAVACDKVPLMAPTGTTITLFAGSTNVPINGSVDITANVIESAGTPVQNGTVVTFLTNLGSIDPSEARTHNGRVTVRLNAGTQSGIAEIRATSGGVTVAAGDALKINIGGAAAGSVQLSADPIALPMSGGTSQLLATVFDTAGNRLPGATVSFSTDAGSLSQSAAITDGNGEARISITTTTTAKVTATVLGGSSAAGTTATVTITLRAGPTVTFGAAVPSPAIEDQPVTIPVTIAVATGGASVRSAALAFGDGATQSLSATGTTNATHTYRSSGTYQLTATATDSAGETTVATTSLIVKAQAPVGVTLSVSAATTPPTTGAVVTFTASTTLPAGATIDRYVWDFGDGGGRTTTGGSTTHIYSTSGRKVVSVRVFTTDGASGFAEIDLIIAAAAMAVSADGLTPAVDHAVTVTASGRGEAAVQCCHGTFGDGASTATTIGQATHAYTAVGTKTVTVRAVLTGGTTATGSISITVS